MLGLRMLVLTMALVGQERRYDCSRRQQMEVSGVAAEAALSLRSSCVVCSGQSQDSGDAGGP